MWPFEGKKKRKSAYDRALARPTSPPWCSVVLWLRYEKVSAFVSSAHKFGTQPTRPTLYAVERTRRTQEMLLLLIQLRFNLRSDNIFRIECVLRNREFLNDIYDFIGFIVIEPNELLVCVVFAKKKKILFFSFFSSIDSAHFTIRTYNLLISWNFIASPNFGARKFYFSISGDNWKKWRFDAVYSISFMCSGAFSWKPVGVECTFCCCCCFWRRIIDKLICASNF